MKTNSTAKDYFFLPFGREVGSLHELLQLPPNASESAIDKAIAQHRKQLKSDKKQKYKQYKEEGHSKEELAKLNAELEEDLTEVLSELNAKKKKVTEDLARKRSLRNQGIIENNPIWSELYATTGELPSLYHLQIKTIQLPIPKQPKKTIEKYQTRTALSIPLPIESDLDHQFEAWQKWHTRYKLRLLLLVDQHWDQLPFTNTDYWREKLSQWKSNHQQTIKVDKKIFPRTALASYPRLSSNTKLSLKRMRITPPNKRKKKQATNPLDTLISILDQKQQSKKQS